MRPDENAGAEQQDVVIEIEQESHEARPVHSVCLYEHPEQGCYYEVETRWPSTYVNTGRDYTPGRNVYEATDKGYARALQDYARRIRHNSEEE